jgi:glycosyltransferase involved in cell wall biosynthesis
VGDGPLGREVRRAVAARGLEERIHLMGWLDDPSPALSAADLFVSTSRWEGLAIAALEAASAGLALVLRDAPGNRDLIEAGIPGVLVPSEGVGAVAQAIDALASDPARRRAMGLEASRIVRSQFAPEALAEDVLAAYDSVLEEG